MSGASLRVFALDYSIEVFEGISVCSSQLVRDEQPLFSKPALVFSKMRMRLPLRSCPNLSKMMIWGLQGNGYDITLCISHLQKNIQKQKTVQRLWVEVVTDPMHEVVAKESSDIANCIYGLTYS